MRIPGERIKRTRLIQSEKYVVAVQVEMVIPVDDPSEPCYEAETVQLLREIKEHAERGDVAWLTRKGKVASAVDGAARTESRRRTSRCSRWGRHDGASWYSGFAAGPAAELGPSLWRALIRARAGRGAGSRSRRQVPGSAPGGPR